MPRKSSKRYHINQVNDTEVDVYLYDRLQCRVCLLNPSQSENRKFEVALPGIGGDFHANYKWIGGFPAERNKRVIRDVEQLVYRSLYYFPGLTEYIVQGIMEARTKLLQANQKYF